MLARTPLGFRDTGWEGIAGHHNFPFVLDAFPGPDDLQFSSLAETSGLLRLLIVGSRGSAKAEWCSLRTWADTGQTNEPFVLDQGHCPMSSGSQHVAQEGRLSHEDLECRAYWLAK